MEIHHYKFNRITFDMDEILKDNLFARMMSVWPEIETPLTEEAIVILEDATLRIRMLSIAEE